MRQLSITQEKGKTDPLQKSSKPKTLLQHIERIIELAENSQLNNDFFRKAKTSINFVSKAMNLTLNQTVLFSLFMEKSNDSHINIRDISKFLGCKNIKAISMIGDMDELEKCRLIRCRRDENGVYYRVPLEVINAVKQGIEYEPENTKNLSTEQLFKHIERLFNERENKEISCGALEAELRSLMEDNSSLVFCRQIKEYDSPSHDNNNYVLLMLFCHRFVNLDDDSVGFHDFEDLYEEKRQFRRIKSRLQKGNNELINNNILEYINNNGFGDNEYYKIATCAKEKLFLELDIPIKQSESKKGIIFHKNIVPKELFYNERGKAQITQLSSLLEPERFMLIQGNLAKDGMRQGFTCLFHGAPGTGKTETVYQIARSTGRDILMVDISETKSMWFGESEKRIKGIFERYRAVVKTSEIAPILLFNEADAVIGKRKVAGNNSMDQTENTIQNIILQEMENLEGIMIATTNLTQNLDKAFERSFLYKIGFEKPCREAKKMIWLAMLPILSDKEATELANTYEFSGGQIENIARKHTIDSILNGMEPSMEAIHNYCRDEQLYKKEERKKIGFY